MAVRSGVWVVVYCRVPQIDSLSLSRVLVGLSLKCQY